MDEYSNSALVMLKIPDRSSESQLKFPYRSGDIRDLESVESVIERVGWVRFGCAGTKIRNCQSERVKKTYIRVHYSTHSKNGRGDSASIRIRRT